MIYISETEVPSKIVPKTCGCNEKNKRKVTLLQLALEVSIFSGAADLNGRGAAITQRRETTAGTAEGAATRP
jgi:hypothetical protein